MLVPLAGYLVDSNLKVKPAELLLEKNGIYVDHPGHFNEHE